MTTIANFSRCDRCAVSTYGFGPSGCSACDCDSVGALNNACDKHSGQCECRERGITGRQCNQCQPGFWSFPDCRTCQCNGHASICDQKTGACIDCRNLTTGDHCETYENVFYRTYIYNKVTYRISSNLVPGAKFFHEPQ